MEGSEKSGPAGSRACSAGPDSQPPVINSGMTAEFRAESLTCPHSRTRPAPLTDFTWPRPLPPTADHPRQEDHVTSAEASRTRAVTIGSPALYQLSYRGGQDWLKGRNVGPGGPLESSGRRKTSFHVWEGAHSTIGALPWLTSSPCHQNSGCATACLCLILALFRTQDGH